MALSNYGVYACSPEWILTGQGESPINMLESRQVDKDIDEFSSIVQERQLFEKNMEEAITTQMIDDGMSPLYAPGDYVGGVKFSAEDSSRNLNFPCIVEIQEGKQLVRLLKKGKKGLFTLCCANPYVKKEWPILVDCEIKFSARIVWHRKPSKQE